jgi:Flp pilus assembly protein TadG
MGMSTRFTGSVSDNRESGQSLVEFAICIPILAFFLFGIIQYGWLFAGYVTIRNASSIGARQAIINLGTGSAATSNIMAVASNAVTPLLDPTKAQVNVTTTNLSSGAATVVQVSYPFALFMPFVVPGAVNGSVRTITATTTIQ